MNIQKRSIIQINNTIDVMCMARAVVVGKYNAVKDESETWNRHLMRHTNKSMQTREAMKLLDQAKILLSKSCGIEEYMKIQSVLAPKYLIESHSQYPKDGLIFPLQFKKAETREIPIYFNGVKDYDAITKVTGFLDDNCCTFHYTPTSNLGYIASPGQFFMGTKLFIGTPLNGKRRCPPKYFGIGYAKMHGFHGNPLRNWDMPTKVLISQLLLILDY